MTRNRCVTLQLKVSTTSYNPGQKYRDKFQNSTRNTSPPLPHPPAPMQCCESAVFMYSPIDFSGFQHCLGEGELPKLRSDGTTKLMTTGYRYPEHKCTLQGLFSYLSKKILARIVDSLFCVNDSF